MLIQPHFRQSPSLHTIRNLSFSTTTSTLTSSPSPPSSPKPHPSNIPESVWSKANSPNPLHTRPGHPLNLIRSYIESHFESHHPDTFHSFTHLPPIVTSTQCFENLLVPSSHPSCATSDTYYLPDGRLLRTHMTAHTVNLIRDGYTAVLASGDVYRRDTVDRTHYPVFHQMDGFKVFPPGVAATQVHDELVGALEGVVRGMFGQDAKLRWVDAHFPFTSPSIELEVEWRGKWLEVLGCGLLKSAVLQKGRISDSRKGWAFGLGLERLAMVLFEVPDIRLFWSQDERVVNQWKHWEIGRGDTYKEVSVYPGVTKDVAFWVAGDWVENDLHEIVREVGGNLAEDVKCVDRFEADGRVSFCYRILFRSMERNLTHVEVNEILERVRQRLEGSLKVELR